MPRDARSARSSRSCRPTSWAAAIWLGVVCPPQHRAALQELRRRYSTRPGAADAALVTELGLFDYLAGRLAICGTPDECLAQVRAARAAGVRRLMFSVSLAVDPVATVRLFGEKVLPAVRT